jgi:hypothetical protein
VEGDAEHTTSAPIAWRGLRGIMGGYYPNAADADATTPIR